MPGAELFSEMQFKCWVGLQSHKKTSKLTHMIVSRIEFIEGDWTWGLESSVTVGCLSSLPQGLSIEECTTWQLTPISLGDQENKKRQARWNPETSPPFPCSLLEGTHRSSPYAKGGDYPRAWVPSGESLETIIETARMSLQPVGGVGGGIQQELGRLNVKLWGDVWGGETDLGVNSML
jgi:hypothetical protein